MASIKLTHRTIESYPLTEKQKDYTDTTQGLVLRTSKTKKAFYFRYRDSNGKPKRKKLGEFPALSLADAREIATEYYLNIQRGIYPNDVNKESVSSVPTLQEVYDNYRDNTMKPKLREASYTVNTSTIEKHILPVFGSQKMDQIRTKDITYFLQDYQKQDYSISHIKKVRQLLLSLFQHGKTLADDLQNPAINAWNVSSKPKPREVFYSKKEIKSIFKHLDLTTQPFKDLVQVLFYTGKRKTETLKMTWDQIDLKKQIWTIPPENTKNGNGDTVYLCDTIMNDVIIPRSKNKKSKYVFHSNWKSHYHTYPTTFHPMKKLIRKKTGTDNFTFHDLRRTLSTHLTSLGVPPHIIDHLLNNASANEHSAIRSTYNRYDYHKEKIEALEDYESFLNEIRLDKHFHSQES
jgi:integrase